MTEEKSSARYLTSSMVAETFTVEIFRKKCGWFGMVEHSKATRSMRNAVAEGNE